MATVLILAVMQAAASSSTVATAASKFVPNVMWRSKSVLSADFTCRGRKEQAILGSSSTDIVIAVFVNGPTQSPEVLRYSTQMRDPAKARLTLESLAYDATDPDAPDLRKYRFSRSCKGLNLDDGRIDAAHIYWNPEAKRFEDWVR